MISLFGELLRKNGMNGLRRCFEHFSDSGRRLSVRRPEAHRVISSSSFIQSAFLLKSSVSFSSLVTSQHQLAVSSSLSHRGCCLAPTVRHYVNYTQLVWRESVSIIFN